MQKLDYQPVLRALKIADQDFTLQNGITHCSEFDEALEAAAVAYNKQNGTNFDPVEARHQYLELCEAEPNKFELPMMHIKVDDLVVEKSHNPSIH